MEQNHGFGFNCLSFADRTHAFTGFGFDANAALLDLKHGREAFAYLIDIFTKFRFFETDDRIDIDDRESLFLHKADGVP